MSHEQNVKAALERYTQAELKALYIDTSLEQVDQVAETLECHLLNNSADWLFASHSIDSDVRSANSVDDLIDYVNITLKAH